MFSTSRFSRKDAKNAKEIYLALRSLRLCVSKNRELLMLLSLPTKMNRLEIPEFASYDEEAAFWNNLDTGDFMQDDGKWFRFETPTKRAVRIAVLPDIAEALAQRAHAQGVSIETLANVLLAGSMSRPVAAG